MKTIRGVRELLELDTQALIKVLNTCVKTVQRYNFYPITLPVLEDLDLYQHALGESSDIVMKQMFKIQDKSIVLRPEGTAGAMRAFLNSAQQGDFKQWCYFGPMFRRESPQKGRFREFYQFGVERIGGEGGAWSDAEMICMAHDILQELGVKSRLHVNTLGDLESRASYTQVLTQYFQQNESKLSPISQLRLQFNPLRILDSKEPQDQEITENAPPITQYLTSDSLTYYNKLLEYLGKLNVPYTEDKKLVRGLDYYRHICFEFISQGQAILGGGRYDGLSQILGGTEAISGVGWAIGLDRVLPQLKGKSQGSIAVMCIGAKNEGFQIGKVLTDELRGKGLPVTFVPEFVSMKKQLKLFGKIGVEYVVFIGQSEVEKGTVTVKNFYTGEQITILRREILAFIQKNMKGIRIY